MRKRIRSHLTYANVIATIALFLVLSGGTAVALSGSNTVFSDDIVDEQVKTADLATGAATNPKLASGAVTSPKVADNSLTGADVNESSLLASRVIAQPTGGALSAVGLTKGAQAPYPLSNATFTQRANEIVEFVSQIKSTLVTSGANTVCQVEVVLSLDGQPFGRSRTDAVSPGPQTGTVATRDTFAVPLGAASSQHTVTATAHLVDHSGSGDSDVCLNVGGVNSQIDSFTLDVIGTR
jgi:hypothetical protein